MDEGWTRFLFDQFEFPFTNVQDPEMRAGHLERNFDVLMDRLGYARYGAQGGDWGGIISRIIAPWVISSLASSPTRLVTMDTSVSRSAGAGSTTRLNRRFNAADMSFTPRSRVLAVAMKKTEDRSKSTSR